EGFDAEAARAYRRSRAGGVRFRQGGPQTLEDLFGGAGRSGASGFGDLFGDLFGANGRPRSSQQSRGEDVASEVTVDFVAALKGAELRLKLPDTGEEITVRIPKGADTGDKVRVAGRGARGARGGPR